MANLDQSTPDGRRITVLAASSGGGHWEQMMLLRPMLNEFATSYATTIAELGPRAGVELAAVLPDTNRNRPLAALKSCATAWRLVRRLKPDVVISTGALPGLLCIIAGRLTGARTLWLESVANTERLSASGRFARLFATRRMTQWAHLASPPATIFDGALL
jgi:UDP-N-acetylglucosamine:LPS N-acetylglucosamine transferase